MVLKNKLSTNHWISFTNDYTQFSVFGLNTETKQRGKSMSESKNKLFRYKCEEIRVTVCYKYVI